MTTKEELRLCVDKMFGDMWWESMGARYWNTRYRAPADKWESNPPVWIAEFVLLSQEESSALKKAKDYLR